MKRSVHNGALAVSLFLLLIYNWGVAGDRRVSPERQLDAEVLRLLIEHSTVIIVAQPEDFPVQDRYGLAMSASAPFKVKATTVLLGDKALSGKSLLVTVARDETWFRYTKGTPYMFFLKVRTTAADATPLTPATAGIWRVVADHFGVQPHSPAMQTMVESCLEDRANQARQATAASRLDRERPR